MKNTNLLKALAIAGMSPFLLFWGCGNSGPLSTDTTTAEHSLAKATATPVEGTIGVNPQGDPERLWYTADGIRHVRGWTIALTLPAEDLEGDLVGTGTFVQNSNWNIEGTGSVSGPFTVEVEWQGIDGTFTTQFTGNVQKYQLSGTFVAHGSGGFEGLKWQARLEGYIGGPYTYSGRIVNPKGE